MFLNQPLSCANTRIKPPPHGMTPIEQPRLGEALGLDHDHVDLQAAMLTVNGKNGQPRLVPLHSTTVTMLTGYAARRDRLCPAAASPAFFITRTGQRIQQRWVQETFAKLLVLAGIQAPPARRRPRIHDLRH